MRSSRWQVWVKCDESDKKVFSLQMLRSCHESRSRWQSFTLLWGFSEHSHTLSATLIFCSSPGVHDKHLWQGVTPSHAVTRGPFFSVFLERTLIDRVDGWTCAACASIFKRGGHAWSIVGSGRQPPCQATVSNNCRRLLPWNSLLKRRPKSLCVWTCTRRCRSLIQLPSPTCGNYNKNSHPLIKSADRWSKTVFFLFL